MFSLPQNVLSGHFDIVTILELHHPQYHGIADIF